MAGRWPSTCLLLWALLATGEADAGVLETVEDVAVEVQDAKGATTRRTITVTVWRETTRSRAPYLVLNHGRAVDAEGRAKVGRARFSDSSRYFVAKGFVVFVPTRIGYGVTGGPDVEDSGACKRKNYPPVYEAAAQTTLRVIDYAKARSYVDPSKGLVIGQSFGGTTAITLAAKNVPGVVGYVNFAGGGGGNPETRPQDPCRNDLLTALFESYGATARAPTLWLYSENDQYFGIAKPMAWFDAFRARGGQGEFVRLPAHGKNGHGSFTANPAAWKPAFERFLAGL